MSTVAQAAPTAVTAKGGQLAYAGAALIVFSILPEILWSELTGDDIGWIGPARLAALVLLTGLGLAWPALRPLWKLAATLLVIAAGGLLMQWAAAQPGWDSLTAWLSPAPVAGLFAVQFTKLGVALLVLVALAALGFTRRAAYLTRGEVNAPAAPERWLGFPRPEPWGLFGSKWLVFLSFGMVVILWVLGRPNLTALLGGWRFIPVVVIISALNAFNEELVYRSALLGSLVGPLGVRPAHLLTAGLFGVSHYYGVPYGAGGVALATVMGWFLGKAMLETKGFFWPWLLHMVADIWIFYFLLSGSVVAGG